MADTTKIVESSNDSIMSIWNNNAEANLINLNKSNVRPLSWIKNNNFKRGMPIALVGAGASLDRSIFKLKEIQDSYFIIATDAALPQLRLNDVKPDLVVTLDPNGAVSKFYDFIISDCTIVCPLTVHPTILSMPNDKFFIFAQSNSRDKSKDAFLKSLAKDRYPYIDNNYFVGATCLQISEMFCPSEVVLFGYDFSYLSGRLYCEGTLRSKFGDNWQKKNDEFFDSLIAQDKIMDFDRNLLSFIKAKTGLSTTGLFKLYLYVFNELIKGKTNIVNCSVYLGNEFISYTDYNTKEFKNGKDPKPNMWNLYTRKRGS